MAILEKFVEPVLRILISLEIDVEPPATTEAEACQAE
jgi:hypothetical protein